MFHVRNKPIFSRPIRLFSRQGQNERERERESSHNMATEAKPKPVDLKKVAGRQKFEYDGRTVYEWEQNLEEVLIYLRPPPGITASQLQCKITATHLSLGLRGVPKPFIDEDFPHKVKVDESMWSLSDGELEISLQKAAKAETWDSALLGHGKMDPFTRSEVQKKLMLERFGEENPGFDFSGAEFSGGAPDPRNFMGGVKYK